MNKTLITVHHLTDTEQSMMSINHILHGAQGWYNCGVWFFQICPIRTKYLFDTVFGWLFLFSRSTCMSTCMIIYNLINIRSLTYSPLLIHVFQGVGELRKETPLQVTCTSDLMAWIYNDIINIVITFFGQSDGS
jgi:hypothetical protein